MRINATVKVGGAPDVDVPNLGGRTSITRRAAPDERCLNVGEYANVLSRFFRSAEGEFSFALLGPWGRGKTYLMELTEEELEQQNPTPPPDPASGGEVPKRYHVV